MYPDPSTKGLRVLLRRSRFLFFNVKGPMSTKQSNKPAPIHSALQHFDKLPDSASARVPVVAALFDISAPTVWRWARDGILPTPTKRGGVTAWNVGQLRAILGASTATDTTTTRTSSATAAAAAKRATQPAT